MFQFLIFHYINLITLFMEFSSSFVSVGKNHFFKALPVEVHHFDIESYINRDLDFSCFEGCWSGSLTLRSNVTNSAAPAGSSNQKITSWHHETDTPTCTNWLLWLEGGVRE